MVYRVYIYDGDEEQEFESSEQVEVFLKVVNSFIQDHDLLKSIALPYVPGENKVLLNSEPVNIDSTEMSYHKQIGDDVYLNANYNKGEKKSLLSQLATECNLDIVFLGWD